MSYSLSLIILFLDIKLIFRRCLSCTYVHTHAPRPNNLNGLPSTIFCVLSRRWECVCSPFSPKVRQIPLYGCGSPVPMCIYMCCTRAHTHTHPHVHQQQCNSRNTSRTHHADVRAHTRMHACMHARTHTHTLTHTHTHTYIDSNAADVTNKDFKW